MDHVLDRLPDRTVRYLMADRGYDGMPNYQYLDDNRVLAVIHIKDTDKGSIYDLKGRPICLGKRPMRYIRTDRGKGHLFRCDPTDDDGHCPLLTKSPWLGARCDTANTTNLGPETCFAASGDCPGLASVGPDSTSAEPASKECSAA